MLVATTAAATTLGTTSTAGAADPATPAAEKAPVSHTKIKASAGKLHGLDSKARGNQTVFVQLSGSGSADVATKNKVARTDVAKVKSRRSSVSRQANDVLATAKRKDSGASKLFTLSNSIPGVALRLDQAGIKAVAARTDVVKVSRIVPKHATNANTAVLTKVINAWHYAGGLGKGVRVGIIDTGIDYTHKDFGGKGTIAAYDAAKAASASPTWRDSLPALGKTKIAGGVDFVGDSYYPDPTLDDGSPNPDYDDTAKPDKNPLDCNEHGTHVAGTTAGYGVTAKGNTFTGNYSALTPSSLLDMKVGPGMAPAATLYGLKVFGCEGSTDFVLPALDWALDPNGDGNFSDHLDIINMSLGSDNGPVDDPENTVIDELTSHGVTSVISAGNSSDLTDVGGSPGDAVSAIGVASSVDSYQLLDGIKVTAPSNVAGMTDGQMSVAYDWTNNGPTKKPVSGSVVAIPGANADGCAPLSAADAAKVKGKVAWLEWDDDDATRACGSVGRSANVKAAGAIGAIFTSGVDVFGAGITGDDTIPVFQLTKVATAKLRPAASAGTLKVTFDGAYRSTVKSINDSISDTLSGFSSRGVHGSIGVVKPDVTAPGDSIASAGLASGTEPLVISGTSMAAPLISGVSALVRSRHPGYTPLQVKAAIMNGAGHDVWTGPNQTGNKYGPARVGAGRVDARHSTNTTVLAYSPGANNPVSASFGVVPAPVGQTTTKTRPLTVLNTSDKTKNVKLSYQPVVSQPGVTYSVSPSTLSVKANSKGSATVTMRVNPAALRHTIDPTMDVNQVDLPRQYVSDASGRVLVTPSGEEALRVPVYGAAKPVSTTTASAKDGSILLTGKGFSQGSGSTQWTSLTSVLRYGASSGALPKCGPTQASGCVSIPSQRAGDLQYVGAGATDDYLWFGLSTYADWSKIGTTIAPYVDFDTTGDGKPDFETTLEYFDATDVMVAVTYNLNDPDADPSLEAANFNLGDVDTNVFDTNVLMLPVSKEAIGIKPNSPLVSYTVNTEGTFFTADGLIRSGDLDSVGPVLFNAGSPRLKVDSELYEDAGNTAIPYTLRGPARALVLHLHGAAGKRAEVLKLPDPATSKVAPSAAPPTQ